MRTLMLTLGTLAAVVCAGTGERYVVTTQDNVGVYENQTRKLFEKPIFSVDKADRLQVVASESGKLKVRAADGRIGWVGSDNVRTVSSRSFLFDRVEVTGYLDNPEEMWITSGDQSPDEGFRLERSFKDYLSENVDQETVERQVQ